MILITGLGNIGEEYKNTRHNIGFMVLDALAKTYEFPEWKEKNKYLYSKKVINGKEIILQKPTTYMNLSGEAIQSITSLYKILPEDIIVIHDDLDIKIGEMRTKQGGGNGGHNGLKNIDSHIGTNYYRIRIGISHPRDVNPKQDVASYVLSKFNKEEKEKIDEIIKIIEENFESILNKDFNKLKK